MGIKDETRNNGRSIQFPTKKILIVDDDPALLRLYEILLKSAQHEVYTANCCHDAKQVSAKELPDLIITDIHFPQESVIEFLNAMKLDAGVQAIPIAVFSSHYLAEEERACYDAGAIYVFIKPYEPKRFFKIVDELLGTSRGET